MVMAVCPECGSEIDMGSHPCEGERIGCAECGAGLEVISVWPLELDWVYEQPDAEWKEIWEEDLRKETEWEEL